MKFFFAMLLIAFFICLWASQARPIEFNQLQYNPAATDAKRAIGR